MLACRVHETGQPKSDLRMRWVNGEGRKNAKDSQALGERSMTVFQLRPSRRDIVKGIGSALGTAVASPARGREFYEGKQIHLVVGSDTGGGYDACARLLARHWPKYIPGSPSVLVRNMPGAGSLNAMNFVANVAPKDGLTVGAPQNTI